MVNIGAVVGINPEVIQTFKTTENFWAHGFSNPSVQLKKDREKFAAKLRQCENELALKYRLAQHQTKNLGLIFGSEKRMREEMEDYETRLLLCDHRHTIVTQVINTGLKILLVSTIHTSRSFQTITSTLEFDQRVRLVKGLSED